MAKIDQTLTWKKVEARLATEQNAVLRRNLELLLQHMKAEATLDMDNLMATVSDKARYQSFSRGGSLLEGKPAVRKFYEDFAASGAYKLHLDIDRLIVDEHCILTEGLMRMAYPGKTLQAMGIEVDDPAAYYLFEAHMAIIWPIGDDGLFIGEDSYTSHDGFEGIAQRKLADDEINVYTPTAA